MHCSEAVHGFRAEQYHAVATIFSQAIELSLSRIIKALPYSVKQTCGPGLHQPLLEEGDSLYRRWIHAVEQA